MSFTEEQRIFIKEKINKKLPGSRIYLFHPHGNGNQGCEEINLYIIAERDPAPDEIKEIQTSLWMMLGNKNLNLSFHKNTFDTINRDVRYALIEGVEL
jgi:hypothetical protein